MKKLLSLSLVLQLTVMPLVAAEETWANWTRRWNDAFSGVEVETLPGRTLGLLVPSSDRDDILPLYAMAYQQSAHERFSTVLLLLPGQPGQTSALVAPGVSQLVTAFGAFPVDTEVRTLFTTLRHPLLVDENLFQVDVPQQVLIHLSALKYVFKGRMNAINVLPIYVRFNDSANDVKDIAPMLVDAIRDNDLESSLLVVVAANLGHGASGTEVLPLDAELLKAFRALDVNTILEKGVPENVPSPIADLDSLSLGVLMLKWLGGDHGKIFAYANTGQLILSKSKTNLIGLASGGVASLPAAPDKMPHIVSEKITDKFGPALRSDMLAMVRQTCLSALNATAAAPPNLVDEEASRKWPAYVTLFDAEGNLTGQAGSHEAVGPLEESLRNYTFQAVRQSKPTLTKANVATYVIELSIPYGRLKVRQPDNLIPLLNGVILSCGSMKSNAFSPHAWRKYQDTHELLSVLSTDLRLPPWTYALTSCQIESFRTLAFNEKEPFQDLGAATRKKKKKSDTDDPFGGDGGGGDSGGGGGGGLFPY